MTDEGSRQERGKKNVSFWWDEQKVERFEDAIWNAKVNGDRFGRNASRSDVIRALLTDFSEEWAEGNRNVPEMAMAD